MISIPVFFWDTIPMYKYVILTVVSQIAIASYAPYIQITLRNKGYSHSIVGIVMALGQLFAIIVPLFVSFLTDKKGKTKPFLLLTVLLAILFAFPFFQARNLLLVIISSCLLDGFFWCFNPLCDGFINRKLGSERYKYGTIRACGTFGYMLSLVFFGFSGFPEETNNTSIMTSYLIFMTLLVFAILIQRDSRVESMNEEKKKFFSFSWFSKGYYLFMIVVFFTRIGQAVVEKLLASYMTEELKIGGYFTLFVALGALSEFFSMLIFSRLLKKKVVTPFFMLSLSAIALVGRLLLYLIPSIYVFIFAQILHSLTFGALHLAATTYTSRSTESSHYEIGMSIYWALATNLPELLGSLCGGFVIEKMGYNSLFAIYSIFPLIGFILSFVFKKEICAKHSS